MHKLTEIWRIEKFIESGNRLPQTPERELARIKAELRKDVLSAELDLERTRLAELLFSAYLKTGVMSIMGKHSGWRLDEKPVVTDNPVQNVWNARYKAKDMAALACHDGAQLP